MRLFLIYKPMAVICILALLTFSVSSLAEDLSFEQWEAGVGEELVFEKSSLENLTMEEASSEDLSNTVIENALRNTSENQQQPAYRQRESEEGLDKESDTQDLIQEQEFSDTGYKELKLPEAPLFERDVFMHPNGRELENNLTTVERQ